MKSLRSDSLLKLRENREKPAADLLASTHRRRISFTNAGGNEKIRTAARAISPLSLRTHAARTM